MEDTVRPKVTEATEVQNLRKRKRRVRSIEGGNRGRGQVRESVAER